MMRIVGNHICLRDENRDQDADDYWRWLNLEEWQYYDEPDAVFVPIARDRLKTASTPASQPDEVKTRFDIDTVAGQHIG